MGVNFSISQVNEIKYLDNKENPYAILEYNLLSSKIEVTDNRSNTNKLTFISKDSPEKMADFWIGLVKSSLDKKLKDLDEVVDEMKREFKVKKSTQ